VLARTVKIEVTSSEQTSSGLVEIRLVVVDFRTML